MINCSRTLIFGYNWIFGDQRFKTYNEQWQVIPIIYKCILSNKYPGWTSHRTGFTTRIKFFWIAFFLFDLNVDHIMISIWGLSKRHGIFTALFKTKDNRAISKVAFKLRKAGNQGKWCVCHVLTACLCKVFCLPLLL